MGQTDRGIGRVDALAAVSGGAHDVDADVLLVNDNVHILRFRHDGHRDRGRVDPAAALRLGHPLHPVDAALVLEPGVGALAGDHEDDLLEAADPVLVDGDQLCPPPAPFRVMHVHPVDLGRKEGRLIAARAGADLHDNVLVIVGVLGEEKDLQLLLQFLHPGFGFA